MIGHRVGGQLGPCKSSGRILIILQNDFAIVLSVLILVIPIGLVISYRELTSLLEKYHELHYDDIKQRLKYFFIISLLGYCLAFQCEMFRMCHILFNLFTPEFVNNVHLF